MLTLIYLKLGKWFEWVSSILAIIMNYSVLILWHTELRFTYYLRLYDNEKWKLRESLHIYVMQQSILETVPIVAAIMIMFDICVNADCVAHISVVLCLFPSGNPGLIVCLCSRENLYTEIILKHGLFSTVFNKNFDIIQNSDYMFTKLNFVRLKCKYHYSLWDRSIYGHNHTK